MSGQATFQKILVSAIVCSSVLVDIGSVSAQGLVPDCTLPFASIAKPHPIDDNCDARGEADEDPIPDNKNAHALQNLAKNNFCATTANPALVTFISFRTLQRKLDQKAQEAKTWGREKLPKDRSLFRDISTTSEGATIGEGSVVTFAAWLMKIRPGSPESCNCKDKNGNGKAPEINDLHLVLIPLPPSMPCKRTVDKTLECKSVTAEISPHFRPDQWNTDIICSAARDHPLRFTGQLMYDASHRPCPHKRSTDPSRISGWEIHPVYAIDVCKNKSLNGCKADDGSVWTPLDQSQGQ
jgi:hypothetical protein